MNSKDESHQNSPCDFCGNMSFAHVKCAIHWRYNTNFRFARHAPAKSLLPSLSITAKALVAHAFVALNNPTELVFVECE